MDDIKIITVNIILMLLGFICNTIFSGFFASIAGSFLLYPPNNEMRNIMMIRIIVSPPGCGLLFLAHPLDFLRLYI